MQCRKNTKTFFMKKQKLRPINRIKPKHPQPLQYDGVDYWRNFWGISGEFYTPLYIPNKTGERNRDDEQISIGHIHDGEDNFICQCHIKIKNRVFHKFVDILNDVDGVVPKEDFILRYENGYIYYRLAHQTQKDEFEFLLMRGWGFLTSVKKLSSRDARRVQDTFGQYFVDKVNKLVQDTFNK